MATVWPLQLFCDVRCAVLDVLISDILLSNHISILANRSAYETQRNRRTGSSFILRTAHQLPLLALLFFFFFDAFGDHSSLCIIQFHQIAFS